MSRQVQYAVAALTLALLAIAAPSELVATALSFLAVLALVEVTGVRLTGRREQQATRR